MVVHNDDIQQWIVTCPHSLIERQSTFRPVLFLYGFIKEIIFYLLNSGECFSALNVPSLFFPCDSKFAFINSMKIKRRTFLLHMKCGVGVDNQ